ncbi:Homeodomain-like protein, partial [Flagelloscypha sp. PMI_526]
MPFRHISADLKWAMVRLDESGLIDLEDILDICKISLRTYWRILKVYRETGDVVRPIEGIPGRPRKLLAEDTDYLLALVRHRPDWFLDELNDLVIENRFIRVHYATIWRELKRQGISLKQLRRIASERDD